MSNSSKNKIRVGIVGLGMVGEPIKKWFEDHHGYRRGKNLFCYDADPKKGYTDDVNKADAVFVAVPTPANPDGSANVSIVQNVVVSLKDGLIIIIKSTVTPGTVEGLQKKYPRKKFIFNPEFLTESQAWFDYIKPDRQIVGHTAKSFTDVKEILALLPRAHFERPWSSDYTKKDINATEAELAKYASNIFGYLKVIYGNILADFCHLLNLYFKNSKINAAVDYENIREAISADPRIGPAWLNVTHGNYCGAGGYCFPKDMSAFIKFGQELVQELAGKNKIDKDLTAVLERGINVLTAAVNYNEAILNWQGLTIQDVSRHDKDIITSKRRAIRT